MASWNWGNNWKREEENSEGTSESSVKEQDEENLTCCHRMTLFSPLIRDILITEPVSKWLGPGVTWAHVFSLTTNAGIALIFWVFLYFLLGDTMLPRNNGFGFYILLILSHLFGRCISSIPYLNLPPVLGMLLAGMIVRNTGLYDIHQELGPANAAKIRTCCITFVAIRAGLQLSTTSLKRHPIFLIVQAVVPSTMEMLMVTVCCRFVLRYPWDWSFMTGTILACMSPAVTMNCVLALAERGYGEDKGLATILCTACCFDNLHVISLFAISYANVFAHDEGRTEWWSYVPAGLRDAILAIVAGVCLGIFFVFFPHRSHEYATWYRMIGLVLASVMCTTATAEVTISGGGYVASMVLSFVAITGWKILSGSIDMTFFRRVVFVLWTLVQPILVGLIGADIDLKHWTWSRLGLQLLCISTGLLARSLAVLFITCGGPFTWKERLFVMICWLPKGTVQAALGPMAYERARHREDERTMEIALDVVEVSFLTMLLLAPIGAVLINITGPLLLNRVTEKETRRERELSYLRILSLQPLPHQPTEEKERKRQFSSVATA